MGTRRRFIASALAAVPAVVILPGQIGRTQPGGENQQHTFHMKPYDLKTLSLDRLQFMMDTDVRYQVAGQREMATW